MCKLIRTMDTHHYTPNPLFTQLYHFLTNNSPLPPSLSHSAAGNARILQWTPGGQPHQQWGPPDQEPTYQNRERTWDQPPRVTRHHQLYLSLQLYKHLHYMNPPISPQLLITHLPAIPPSGHARIRIYILLGHLTAPHVH